jgi:hypothetical protein
MDDEIVMVLQWKAVLLRQKRHLPPQPTQSSTAKTATVNISGTSQREAAEFSLCKNRNLCTERLTRLAIVKENRADDVVVAIIDSFFFFSPVIALPADRARRAQRG